MSIKTGLKRFIFTLFFSFATIAVVCGGVEKVVDAVGKYQVKPISKPKKVILKTEKAINKKISKGLAKFDKKITLYISKKLYKKPKDFWETLHKNDLYKDLFGKIKCSMNYDKCSKYHKIELFVKYKTTRDKFRKLRKSIIHTEKELIEKMVKNMEKVRPSFTLNISNKLIDFENKKQADRIFDELYKNVEFSDIATNGFQYVPRYKSSYWKVEFKVQYDITRKDIDNLNSFIKTWVDENISSDMTEADKAKKIFEFMTLEYDYSYGDKGEEWFMTGDNSPKAKLGKYNVRTSFALVFKKAGICAGYTRLFYRLAKAAGLEAIYVSGNADNGTTSARHAWNMVKAEGNWYHVDVTWGRGRGASSSEVYVDWEYCLKGDVTMSDETHRHSWDRWKYPVAEADYIDTDNESANDIYLIGEDEF